MTPPDPRFSALDRLYGDGAFDRLAAAHVMVIGVGGVGSWAAEALARSGVGRLTLVDLDDVCQTNINRQIHALDGTVGRPKVEVLAERIAAFHPACRVEAVHTFYDEESAEELFARAPDWIIDAIDALPAKIHLVRSCVARGQRLVVCGGAGGRRDPTALEVDDLAVSINDGLLRRLRKLLKRDFGFPREGLWDIPCVFSKERQAFPNADGTVSPRTDGSSLRLDCATGFGTAAFATGAYGFAAASVVVSQIGGRPIGPTRPSQSG